MANTPNMGLPMPDDTANVDDEFYRLQQAWLLLDAILFTFQTAIAGKSELDHVHPISGVTGLAAALAAKMDASRTFALDDLTDVQGAAEAAINYVLVMTASGQWQPSSAIAALGIHQHPPADIVGLAGAVDARIANWVGAAPTALDTLLELSAAVNNDPAFGTTVLTALANRIRFDVAQALSNAQKVQALANIGADDPWRLKAIGEIVYIDTHLGLSPPPTDRGYRYADLSAGLTGPGQYNEGVLTGETVSGSGATLLASAVVDLAGSPLFGKTLPLLNTEGRILRPSTAPGTLQNDQMQVITGTLYGITSDRAIAHAGQNDNANLFTASGTNQNYAQQGTSSGGKQNLLFNSANAPGARAGTETRMKNQGSKAFRRVL